MTAVSLREKGLGNVWRQSSLLAFSQHFLMLNVPKNRRTDCKSCTTRVVPGLPFTARRLWVVCCFVDHVM